MKLAIKTCTLDMPYADMLDFCAGQGVSAVEIGTGNWSGAPHIDLEEMVSSGSGGAMKCAAGTLNCAP